MTKFFNNSKKPYFGPISGEKFFFQKIRTFDAQLRVSF